MSDPYSKFGLTCPKGGRFYICQGAATEFIGCCSSDPCGKNQGKCAEGDIHPASYNADSYHDLGPQDCDASDGATHWYTCSAINPPFMGCCSVNPCQSNGCPAKNLLPAKLSKKENDRAAFTTTNQPTSTPAASDDHSQGGLSAGAIAGIAVGVGLLVIVIIGILMYNCGWWARKTRDKRERASTMSQFSPQSGLSPMASPYRESHQPDPLRQSYKTATSNAFSYQQRHSPMSADFGTGTHHSHNQMSPVFISPQYSSIHGVSQMGFVPNAPAPVVEIDGRERQRPASELPADFSPQHIKYAESWREPDHR